MTWKKATEAARDWCGGISVKALYAAVNANKLRAAKVGITSTRNLLFCEEWCTEWLLASATTPVQRNAPGGKPEAIQNHNGDGGVRKGRDDGRDEPQSITKTC